MSKELLDRYYSICNEIFEKRLITTNDKDAIKLRKIVKAVAAFIATDYKATILDLVTITGLSKSSIQRYLNEEKIISELFNVEIANSVKQGLEDNKVNARIKGGLNSYRNNVAVKDSDGKFIGTIPYKTEEDKVAVKNEHIIKLARIYLSEDNMSLSILSKVTKLRKGLWVAMTANPIGLIVAAIAGLVAGFVYLWNNCEGFRDFWIGIWEGIKTVFGVVVNWLGDRIKWVAGVFTGFKDTMVNIGNAIKTFFGNIGNAIANVIKTPINWIIDALNVFIRGVNKIKIPNWVPGVGGKGFNISTIPRLNVGTNYVPEDTLAMIHEGEAVVPKKFNPYANGINPQTIGSINGSVRPIINVYANFEQDPLGQLVNTVKTFSGGSKNDYNYGAGV
jgi:hypothetical protein